MSKKRLFTDLDYDVRWTDDEVGSGWLRFGHTMAGDFVETDWELIVNLDLRLARYRPTSRRLSVRKAKGRDWEIGVTMQRGADSVMVCAPTLPEAIVELEKHFLLPRR